MSRALVVRILAYACVALMFCFMAETVEAQRRGGGGRGGGRGGGGRSISRAGPASGGSFRPSGGGGSWNRPSTRPSPSRPSASTRPSTRPVAPQQRPSTPSASTRPATQPGGTTRPGSGQQRPGSGGTGAATDRPTRPSDRPSERPSERPGSGTENREDWQQHADDAREDRQKYQKNAREDWQDFAEENGAYYYGGYYGGYYGYRVVDYDEDYNDWAVALAGFAVGTALTSASFSSMQKNTACTLSEVTVNGVRYFKCGSTWYNRVIDGTNVNYVIVSAPPGY